MIRRKLTIFLAALVPCGVVAAEDGEGEFLEDGFGDAVLLPPVVVTAGRFEGFLGDAPNTVEVIDDVELREKLYRTLPEAFAETPGVMVQKTAHGHGSPFIRGFTGFRNLLMVDGIRLNNSVFREGPNQYWSTVDPYSLSRIELVKGQGSVLYGSDAIGGTVNALTKSALDGWGDGGGFFAGGEVFYRWSSAEQSHVGRVEVQTGKAGKYGLHLGYTQKDYGAVRAADIGEQAFTGYGEWDVDARLDVALSDAARLTLAYQQVQQDDIWRTHKTVYGVSYAGSSVGSEQRRVLDQHRRLGYVQLELDEPVGWIDRAKFSASWQGQDEQRDRVRKVGDGRREVQGFDVDTLELWAQFESASPVGTLTYGASYYRDWVESERLNYAADGSFVGRSIQGPVGDDATYDLFGVFVQDQIEVCEAVDVFLGGRYTYAEADIGRVEDPVTGLPISIADSWDDFSVSGRVLFRPLGDDRLEVFGGLSQGFRAPNLSDLSRLDSARSSEIETAAPGLEPEQFLSSEIGVRATAGPVRAGLSYFYTDIDDMIVRTPTGRVIGGELEVTKRNGGEGYVQGIEFDAEWELVDGLTLFGGVTWMDGEADTYPTSAPERVREPLSRVMPLTGVAGVRCDVNDRLWVEFSGTVADRADELNTRDRGDTQRIPPGGTPGYTLLTLRGGWQVTDEFLVTAAVQNLTDDDYRVHGSGQNEPGLGVILGGSLRF